jgi:hypothetical protein
MKIGTLAVPSNEELQGQHTILFKTNLLLKTIRLAISKKEAIATLDELFQKITSKLWLADQDCMLTPF